MPARLHHITVFVNDMDRSLELFQGLLGMENFGRLPVVRGRRISGLLGIPEFEAEMVFLKDQEQQVFLELVRPAGLGEKPEKPNSLNGVGLSLTVSDLDGLHSKLNEAGWSPISDPIEMPDPSGSMVRIFCIRTDEGLLVELIEQAD